MIELADPFPTPPPPRLPGSVVLRPNPDDVIDAAAADVLIQANNCVRAFGDFHLAVSVVGTEQLLRRLMYDPALRELPWKRTHLWMVEEVAVPEHDERRLFPLLRDLLVEPSDIPLDQVHAVAIGADGRTEKDAHEPAAVYESRLRECLGWREKGHDRLDLVLMACSGSAAPGSALNVPTRLPSGPAAATDHRLVHTVPAVRSQLGADLISMTAPMLRAARFISVLAIGERHREIVAEVVARRAPVQIEAARDFPRSGLLPFAGELRWYLDADACPKTGAPTL